MPIRLAAAHPDAYPYPLLIRHLLHTPLATAPAQEIVYRDRVRYNYACLNQRIARLASGLTDLGVDAGSIVAIMDWDSHRYLECFFAVPMMGAVLQTVNIRLSAEQILYTLQHAGAEVILVHRDFVPMLAGLVAQLPRVRAMVLIDESTGSGTCAVASGPATTAETLQFAAEYEQLLGAASVGFEFRDFDENAIATTFYTTGTTGQPKAVCFSHRQLVLHTLAVLCAFAAPACGPSLRDRDVYMPLTPMFHVHAWGFPYVATVLGIKQVYPGRYVASEILALRARESVTYSHCVPTILQMLLSAATGNELRGWKITVGGAALSPALAAEASRRGVDVHAAYGMSETGPVLTAARLLDPFAENPTAAQIERRCRAGLPIPLVDLQLLDGERRLAKDGSAAGELVVRAPWLTSCYLGNPGASADLWHGGYLHTQDVAQIDAEGYLRITDRLKDVIKSGGEWLSSLQLESLISMLPGVAEVAVIPTPDARWGERPHALIVPRPQSRSALTAQAVREFVAEHVARGAVPRYAIPERVTFVEALERTSVGKINKRRLRELYG